MVSPAPPSAPSAPGTRATGSVVPALAGLLALALVAFAPQVLNDPDTFWHLAAGGWMLDHGRVPDVDVFSYTFAGKPWHAHEWLSEVLMALAYRAGGWSGLVLLHGAAAAATFVVLARRLGRHLPPLSQALSLVLVVCCMAPSLLARPHLLVLPLVVIWTDRLLAAREADRPPPMALALLMALWANLHGGYVFGLGLLAPFALEAVAEAPRERRLRVLAGWALFGVASFAASLATPFGAAGLSYPLAVLDLSFLPAITEWRPQDFSKTGPFEVALLGSLFVLLGRGVRIPPMRLALLLVLLHMALHQTRHQILLGPVAALLIAEPLGRALGADGALGFASGGRRWLAGAALAGLLLAGVRLALPVERADAPGAPIAALAHVPDGLRAQPVFNDYSFGGYLIFAGVRPFIDGRSDMYGEAFTSAYFQASRPDPAKLGALFDRWGVAWTLLPPNDPVTAVMDQRPGWRRLYADRYAVVHVRGAPPR